MHSVLRFKKHSLLVLIGILLTVLGAQSQTTASPTIDRVRLFVVDSPLPFIGTTLYIDVSNAQNLYLGISARTSEDQEFAEGFNTYPVHLGDPEHVFAFLGDGDKLARISVQQEPISENQIRLTISTNSFSQDAQEIVVSLWEEMFTEEERPDDLWCQRLGVCLGGRVFTTGWIPIWGSTTEWTPDVGISDDTDGERDRPDATSSLHLPANNVILDKTYGGVLADDGWRVIPTQDDGYAILARTEEHNTYTVGSIIYNRKDIWLIKLDPFGFREWSQTFDSGPIDQPRDVFQTEDGGFLVFFDDHDNENVIAVRLDSQGVLISRQDLPYMSGASNVELLGSKDYGFFVQKTNEEALAGVSSSLYKVSDIGEFELEYTVSFPSDYFTQTSDGHFVLAGRIVTVMGADIQLTKITRSGELLWRKILGTADHDRTGGVRVTPQGDYVLSALEGGRIAFYAFDSDGMFSWKTILNDVVSSVDDIRRGSRLAI